MKKTIRTIIGRVKKYEPNDEQAIFALNEVGITDIPAEIEARAYYEEEEIGQVVEAEPKKAVGNLEKKKYYRVQFNDGDSHKWKETEKFKLDKLDDKKFVKENKGKDSAKWSKE